MKRLFVSIGALLFSQQLFAITTVAGVDFLNIANSVTGATGTYTTNYAPGGRPAYESVADMNGASWAYSSTPGAYVDLSFGGGVFNVSDVDLSILFVGDGEHSGSVTLLGGSQTGSDSQSFDILGNAYYTSFNSETANPPSVNSGAPTDYGIYSTNLHLVDAFSGTFAGVRLNIGGSTAVPSLLGTVNVTAVPVPAAVWLFGSGLVGLVGFMRKRA